jgi:large subunit ribosomal protein L35
LFFRDEPSIEINIHAGLDSPARGNRRGNNVMPRNRSKPKLKLKTHRGARKRFKITATGKIIRMHSGKRHLLGTKAAKRMRKLKKLTQVNKRDVPAVRQMMPYSF